MRLVDLNKEKDVLGKANGLVYINVYTILSETFGCQ